MYLTRVTLFKIGRRIPPGVNKTRSERSMVFPRSRMGQLPFSAGQRWLWQIWPSTTSFEESNSFNALVLTQLTTRLAASTSMIPAGLFSRIRESSHSRSARAASERRRLLTLCCTKTLKAMSRPATSRRFQISWGSFDRIWAVSGPSLNTTT